MTKDKQKKTAKPSNLKKDVYVMDAFGEDDVPHFDSNTGSHYRNYNENVGIENSAGKRQIIGAVNAWD